MACRYYYKNRVSLIFIPHPRSNIYLTQCFQGNLDPFVYRSFLPQNIITGQGQYWGLRFLLMLAAAITNRFHFSEYGHLRSQLSLALGTIQIGREETGCKEPYYDWTGYIRVLHSGIGPSAKLSNPLRSLCREKIRERFPQFSERPFATILLRRKKSSTDFYDRIRSAGPAENYATAIRYLIKNGYYVAGTGETDHDKFAGIDGYFSLKEIDIERKLLNIFLLTECKLYIGQHSGPYILPNTCGIPVLLTDSLPFWLGTFNPDDLILYKRLTYKSTGRTLSTVEVFKHHDDLAYGYGYAKNGVEISPCSSDEILDAVRETLAIVRRELTLTREDEELILSFRRLIRKDMWLYYQGNRIPLSELRLAKTLLIGGLE